MEYTTKAILRQTLCMGEAHSIMDLIGLLTSDSGDITSSTAREFFITSFQSLCSQPSTVEISANWDRPG